jgi:uncharacterized protein YndB with AHSA1/START domain
MELKTKIKSEEGKQELFITREFDLPVELLFKAYEEAEFIEQWMGTKVLELENKNHGSYRFETTGRDGSKHNFHGVIHEFIPNKKIIRTFEMASAPFGPQLEFLEFEKMDGQTSRLTMQVIYKSASIKDQQLKLPFAQGLSMAHDRIEELMKKSK